MSSRQRKKRTGNPTKRADADRHGPARPPWLLLLLASAALIAVVVVLMKSRDTETGQPQASPAGTAESTSTTAPAAAPVAEKLVGKWQRTDGDYALDVRRVWADGRAEVAYANPGPINVGRAEVKEDAGRLVLVVELRDVN